MAANLPFHPYQRALRAVIGGWSLNGITTIQSGQPVLISSAANTTNSSGGTQRPNSTGISSQTRGSIKERVDCCFNQAAFANPPKFTFDNVGRNLPDNLEPALQVWNLSVLKHIPVHEAKQFGFRAWLFNLFKNVNFQLPDGDSATIGRPQFGTLVAAERARIIQSGLKLRY